MRELFRGNDRPLRRLLTSTERVGIIDQALFNQSINQHIYMHIRICIYPLSARLYHPASYR
jgi:hypothetical protein